MTIILFISKTRINHIILILLVFLLFACNKNIQAQVEVFDQFNEKTSGLHYEKVYLHIDRSIYTIKDDIWFKIYLTDGKTHIPVSGYNTVYVDLADPDGNILIHKPYLVENGTGHGNFTIADTLKTGTYTIYAYTNYLRNFGINSFFKREILISYIQLTEDKQIDELENNAATKHLMSRSHISLQFMPEGGYLSDNIPNSLAFKITGFAGKGINHKGVIKDSNGHFIDSLQSTHLGMGKIFFRPQSGMQYHAILDEFAADTFLLPPSTDKPLLQYTGIKDSIVQFKLFDRAAFNSEKVYYIAVKAKGTVSFYIKKSINTTVSLVSIRLENFRTGINQIVLLDSNLVPLSERLFFIPGTPKSDLSIQLDKEIFNTREKTNIILRIPDETDASIGGSFSMAVINLDQTGTSGVPSENIISFLELESEIRGYIEEPGYYFSQPYETVKEELDLLLLTQGWRRYIWDGEFTDSLSELKFEKEKGFTISGQAQRMLLNRGLEEGKIILFIPAEYIVLETMTDSTGYFKFDNLILFDSTKIFVQSRNKNNRKNSRLIDANYLITQPPAFSESEILSLSNSALQAYNKNAYRRYVSNSYFNFDKDNILIEEVTIVGKRKEKDDGHFRMYSQANNVIDMAEYPGATSYFDLFMFLQGRVPGLYIEGEYLSIRRASGPPLILLDGIEVDAITARNIPLVDVDKIEVLKDASNTAVFGVKGGNGVIAIYTKRGESVVDNTPLFDIISKTIEGYGIAKEFYMPDYDNPETNTSLIDQRATLFWAPDLIPDSTGSCSVSFFNSDDTGKIAVIVEGILNNGKPGMAKAYYWVRRE